MRISFFLMLALITSPQAHSQDRAQTYVQNDRRSEVRVNSAKQDAFTLSDAIATGIANNKTQQANRLIIEAAHEEAKANRLNSFRPSINFHIGLTRDGLGPTVTSDGGLYQSSGISAGLTIYDGGARRRRANAQDLEVEALEAKFNSTNALFEDTSGALARIIFQSYMESSQARMNAEIYDENIALLEKISDFVKDTNAKSELTNILATLRTNSKTTLEKYENLNLQLEYQISTNLPAELESLEQTNNGMIQSLIPYSDIQYAISVAKEKNQNYLARLFELKATEENAAATKAELTRPKVSAVAGDTYSQATSYGDNSNSQNSRDGYVALQFTYSLQPGMRQSLSASKKQVTAARQKAEKETDDFTNNIVSDFRMLATADKTILDYRKNVDRLRAQINTFVDNALAKGVEITPAEFDALIKLIDQLGNNLSQYYSELIMAIHYRYDLLKEIGVLFEICELKGDEKCSSI